MIRRSFLLLLGLLAAPASLSAQVTYATAPAADAYADVIAQSRALIDSVMRVSGIPGLSIAVAVDGQIVWSEGFGFADVEQRTPVTPLSKFRVGSIAKPLTAVALGQLYEQGRLDLDAPVQRYVPSFPEKRWPITTRLVAGHLAGIRHYRGDEFVLAERFDDVLAGLEIFQDDTLLFEPGTRYSYSTYGWNLLSAVVEGASGQPFLRYMREHVFGPLGMRHTAADHVDSIIPWRTGFYERRDDGAVLNAPYVDNSYKWAGGGFLSTPEDLIRFAQAHLDATILSAETIDLWWTPQRTSDGQATNYGIGWQTADLDGIPLVLHGGGSIGGTSMLAIAPEQRVVFMVTCNLTGANYHRAPQRILRAFVDAVR